MIKCDYLTTRSDGVILVKTYSTENKYIKQVETGLEYYEAVDIGVYKNGGYKPLKYIYVETDKEIQVEEKIPVEVEEEL